MKGAAFFVPLAILLSIPGLAQSDANYSNTGAEWSATAEEVSQAATYAQRAIRRLDVNSQRPAASPMSALSFANADYYLSGGTGASSVAVADVNGDGKPDIVVANNGSSTVGVLLGNGDGTFQTAATYSSGGEGASSVAVADVNGDGKLDIVVTNPVSATVSVLLGNGDSTFQPAVPYGSGGLAPDSVAIADLNGDGKLDLVVANLNGGGTGDGNVAVLLGNGDGTFQTAVSYGLGSCNGQVVYHPNSVAVADFNRDGKPDIVVASECETMQCLPDGFYGIVTVLYGNGDGTFPVLGSCQGFFSSSNQDAAFVAAGDMNGDGYPDFVIANYCNYTAQNCWPNADSVDVDLCSAKGCGTSGTYNAVGYGLTAVALADVNADGNLDVVATSSSSNDPSNLFNVVGILLGNGDGTLQPVVIFSLATLGPGMGIGESATSVATADLNGDGSPDLVVASPCDFGISLCNGQDAVNVFLNSSTGTASATTLDSISPSAVIVGSNITLTAKVSSTTGPPPNGEIVTFKNSAANVTLGTGALVNGTATFTSATILPGTYSVVASYPGGAGFWSSVSVPQVLKVQDFEIAANPATMTGLSPGQGSTVITLTALGGFNGTVILSCTGLPSGASCGFSPTSIANGSGTADLTITTSAATPIGSYPVTVSGTSSSLVRSAVVMLVVQATPGFAIGPASGSSTSQTITAGQSAKFSLTVTPSGSFTGMVDLSCSITPVADAAPTCGLPSSVQISGTSGQAVTVTIGTTGATGTSATTSYGNLPSGCLPLAWIATLFLLGYPWLRSRKRSPIFAAPIIVLTMTLWAACGGTSTSSSKATSGTPAGTYTATVTATSGSLSHSMTLTVTVE